MPALAVATQKTVAARTDSFILIGAKGVEFEEQRICEEKLNDRLVIGKE